MQVVVKVARKTEEPNFGENCSYFESSREISDKCEYLVRCSLDHFSCDSQRWRTLPVCHSSLTAGNWQSWGAGKQSGALPWAMPCHAMPWEAVQWKFLSRSLGNQTRIFMVNLTKQFHMVTPICGIWCGIVTLILGLRHTYIRHIIS